MILTLQIDFPSRWFHSLKPISLLNLRMIWCSSSPTTSHAYIFVFEQSVKGRSPMISSLFYYMGLSLFLEPSFFFRWVSSCRKGYSLFLLLGPHGQGSWKIWTLWFCIKYCRSEFLAFSIFHFRGLQAMVLLLCLMKWFGCLVFFFKCLCTWKIWWMSEFLVLSGSIEIYIIDRFTLKALEACFCLNPKILISLLVKCSRFFSVKPGARPCIRYFGKKILAKKNYKIR